MAADANQIQQMLANLQSQITTVSNMAGQIGTSPVPSIATIPALDAVGVPNPVDIAALVKAEMQKYIPAQAPVPISQPPMFSPPAQIAAPIPEPVAVPEIPTPVPALPPPQPPPQPNMQDMMMKNLMGELKSAIGAGLTGDQQLWISGNLFGLPPFLRSDQGKAAIQDLLSKFKQSVDASRG